MEKGRLTTQDYWVDYYSKPAADLKVIEKTCGFFDPIWQKMFDGLRRDPLTIVEIGAFPGRFLAYLSRKFGLRPTGIDFNPEVGKFAQTMELVGIRDYDYLVRDFLTTSADQQFDVVFSNGFIEHFDDYEKVMDLHCEYLAPGGTMVIMVPNKRYLRYLYGLTMDYENLRIHNLRCMKKSVFRDFARRNALEVIDITYFGGFPYKVHDYNHLNRVQEVAYRATAKVFRGLNPLLSRHPGKWWSGSLIGIFRKPLDTPL